MYGDSFKRQREYEDLSDPTESFTPKKKHRSLALRTSPRSSQQSNLTGTNGIPPHFRLSRITPVQSSDDDEDGLKKCVYNGSARMVFQQLGGDSQTPLSSSTPMELDNNENIQPTAESGGHTCNDNIFTSSASHHLVQQSFTAREDIKPAHDYSKQAQHITRTADYVPLRCEYNLDSGDVDAGKAQKTQWTHNHGPPSPISDNGDVYVHAKDLSSDADMSCSPAYPESPPLWDICSMEAEPTSIAMALSNIPDRKRPPGVQAVSTSSKKLAISMGYRADCDKCRRKVPGHYSHIIKT